MVEEEAAATALALAPTAEALPLDKSRDDFLGMIDFLSVAASDLRDRREYEVFGTLLDGVPSGSWSVSESGAARFFPLGSRAGSLIVRADAVEGSVIRRLLQSSKGNASKHQKRHQHSATLTACCF